MSKEWDASKVPPSRFQKREGSIYSTPSSRDAHVKGSERDKAYHDKLKEKVRSTLTAGKRLAAECDTNGRAGLEQIISDESWVLFAGWEKQMFV